MLLIDFQRICKETKIPPGRARLLDRDKAGPNGEPDYRVIISKQRN